MLTFWVLNNVLEDPNAPS